ncbi:hypothetical protein C8R46DRAFT_36579 [Mycena filopes]|nr:hypothetical protein C8R46DRAFT_36579 [Mycena filopes]
MAMPAPPPAKAKRNRVPSSRITDNNNNEAPSADQQRALATKPVLDLIKKIRRLSGLLPDSVPEPSEEDKVHRIITTLPSLDDTLAGEFNRRFDNLFGEDCRDADGRLQNIRRGVEGMDCVVAYLESIHWKTADIPLDLAQNKLQRLADALALLCASDTTAAAAKRPAAAPKKPQATSPADGSVAGGRGEAWETMMDKVFEAATNVSTKKDKDYVPKRRNPVLSEESADEFDQQELDTPVPEGGRKRKRIIIEGDGSGATEASTARGKKRKAAPAAAAPKVTVIEIDDSDDEEVSTRGKRGPKNTSRDHFHDPIAVKYNGEPRWEFKCRHCTKSSTFPRTVGRDKTFKQEPTQPNIGNLATHLKTHGGPTIPIPGATPVGETRGISAVSAKIMADYLAEGKLNPAITDAERLSHRFCCMDMRGRSPVHHRRDRRYSPSL